MHGGMGSPTILIADCKPGDRIVAASLKVRDGLLDGDESFAKGCDRLGWLDPCGNLDQIANLLI